MGPALLYQEISQHHHMPLCSSALPTSGSLTTAQLNIKSPSPPYVFPNIKSIPIAGGFLVLTTILCLPRCMLCYRKYGQSISPQPISRREVMFFLLPQLSSPVLHQALSKFTRAASSRFPWSRAAACPPRVIKTNDTLLVVVRDIAGPLHGEKVWGEKKDLWV